MLKQIVEIFTKVQLNKACHRKYLRIINSLYKKSPFDEFVDNLMLIMTTIFKRRINKSNISLKRALAFFGKAFLYIDKKERNVDRDGPPLLLSNVIEQILEYTNASGKSSRYYSTKFFDLLLSNVKPRFELDEGLLGKIRDKMFLRLEDNEIEIKLLAISALSYIQNVQDDSCPVIEIFIKYLNDYNEDIRREIIRLIEVNDLTLEKIIERVNDVHETVREIVYWKMSVINPCKMKIIHRVQILNRGFKDINETTEIAFYNMLKEWYLCYQYDHFKFLYGLYLSSNEYDLAAFSETGKSLIQFFLEFESIEDLIQTLPVENKLILGNHFKIEIVFYWKCVVNYLKSSSDFEDYLEEIIPDLTEFCPYIERIISTTAYSEIGDSTWEVYQFYLLNLFEIVHCYDLTDEAGRRALRELLKDILVKYQFNEQVLTKIIEIYFDISTIVYFFINDIHQIITDIVEPYKEQEENEQKTKSICQALDILIKVLELPAINELDPNLRDLKDDFLLPLLLDKNFEIYRKALKCLAGFCYIDKDTAEGLFQYFILPILEYQLVNPTEYESLETSIVTLINLFRIYGKEITNIDHGSVEYEDADMYSPEFWFTEILIQILEDDKCTDKFKITTLTVLCETSVLFPLTSSNLVRILLKYFLLNLNHTLDTSDNMYQIFIDKYIQQNENSKEVLIKTIEPVLSKIINARDNNPISKIKIEHISYFYSMIINSDEEENLGDSMAASIGKTREFLSKILFKIDLKAINFDENDQIPSRISKILINLHGYFTRSTLKKLLNKLRNKRCNRAAESTSKINKPTTKTTTKRKRSPNGNRDVKPTGSSNGQIDSIPSTSGCTLKRTTSTIIEISSDSE